MGTMATNGLNKTASVVVKKVDNNETKHSVISLYDSIVDSTNLLPDKTTWKTSTFISLARNYQDCWNPHVGVK